MKKCSACKIEKPIEEFYKNKTLKDGHSGHCKTCHKISQKKTIQKDHRRRLNNQKRYREKNRENLRIKSSEYVKENYDKRIKYYLKYAKDHRVKKNAQRMVYHHVKQGNIIKPKKCEHCGSERKIEAHHIDYSNPLDVIWLCKYCHEKIHHEEIAIND